MSKGPVPLTVASPYGPGQAGYRARVAAWTDRFALPVDEHCYFGPSGTARSSGRPGVVRSLRAERGLRRLRKGPIPALLVHREASPFSTGKLEVDLIDRSSVSVFDIDDALYADWGGDALLRRLFAKAGKAAAAAERASITVAGNDVVADWAAAISRDVRIVPTCVEPGPEPGPAGRPIGDPPVLVWVGSPSTVPHLTSIARPLLQVHRSTGAVLRLIGGSVAGTDLEAMTTSEPWSPEVERGALADADIGLMPLPDRPLERGKCGYKLLQYGAAAVPAVASPVGVNAEILDLFGAPAPETDAEWLDALTMLIDAPATLRRDIGRRAHAVVTEQFSFDAWEPVWGRLVGDLGLSS